MKLEKTVNGVVYTRRLNAGDPNRYVWEGGPVGGTVFVSKKGQFGTSTDWHDTFESAAYVQQQKAKRNYERLKEQVDAYEKQLNNGGRATV